MGHKLKYMNTSKNKNYKIQVDRQKDWNFGKRLDPTPREDFMEERQSRLEPKTNICMCLNYIDQPLSGNNMTLKHDTAISK